MKQIVMAIEWIRSGRDADAIGLLDKLLAHCSADAPPEMHEPLATALAEMPDLNPVGWGNDDAG